MPSCEPLQSVIPPLPTRLVHVYCCRIVAVVVKVRIFSFEFFSARNVVQLRQLPTNTKAVKHHANCDDLRREEWAIVQSSVPLQTPKAGLDGSNAQLYDAPQRRVGAVESGNRGSCRMCSRDEVKQPRLQRLCTITCIPSSCSPPWPQSPLPKSWLTVNVLHMKASCTGPECEGSHRQGWSQRP